MMLRPVMLAGLVALVALSIAGSYLAGISYGWFGELGSQVPHKGLNANI